MENNLKKAFEEVTYVPLDNLSSLIWGKIAKREKTIERAKIYAFSGLGILSFIGFIPLFKMMLSDMSSSGFYEYLSIAFSNGGLISSYWRELLLSLSESIPLTSLIYSFGFLFVFFLSMRFLMKQISKSRLSISLNY